MGAKRTDETEMSRAVMTAVALVVRGTGNAPEHVLERIGPPDGFVSSLVKRQIAANQEMRAEEGKE